jgi:hypothetical protein
MFFLIKKQQIKLKAVAEKIKQEREMMKLEISEGEVVFSQNSLTHE